MRFFWEEGVGQSFQELFTLASLLGKKKRDAYTSLKKILDQVITLFF